MTNQIDDLPEPEAGQPRTETPEIEPEDADVLGEDDDNTPEEVDQ